MKSLIVVALLFISYSTASEMAEEETEDELLSRVERATSYWATNKSAEYDGCDAGEFAVELRNEDGKLTGYRCDPCSVGFFTQTAGFWEKCIPCEFEHQTTPPGYNGKCYSRCPPGKGWNSILRKCEPCEPGFYQPEESFNECLKCPLFHNSTRADAECLLECPRGMEPTEDGTSCTQCKVGYFQKVPGRKGVNEKCVICCESPCLTNKNWTYVIGANATNQCIKLPNPLKTCYPYLITALANAVEYIYADDTKETLRPLLTALCLSGADLQEMAIQIQACSVRNVTVAGVKVPAYPQLRINATLVIDMKTEVFDIHGTPECPPTTTTEPTTAESRNMANQGSSTTGSTSSTSPTTSSSSTSSTSSTTSTTGMSTTSTAPATTTTEFVLP